MNQILIGIGNKFENIDPEELLHRLQAKKMDNKYVIGLDVDDLYGKALSAVKNHWNQKYVMSKEEEKVFLQLMSTSYSQHNYSQHKIGYIEFLRTKQKYKFVKEDWADEIRE